MIEYFQNRADAEALVKYFDVMRLNDDIHAITDFPPYVEKLLNNALIYEAWSGDCLVGFCAAYCNRAKRDFAFIPQINVLPAFRGQGIGHELILRVSRFAMESGFCELRLCVNKGNFRSRSFYESMSFKRLEELPMQYLYSLDLRGAGGYDRV